MVSVLLPVKGVHERTLMHWRSQVKASHGGRMEFIFCMESEEDPAYAAALDFRRECGDSVEIKIVSCGLSFYCSQKIHNLLKGITLVNCYRRLWRNPMDQRRRFFRATPQTEQGQQCAGKGQFPLLGHHRKVLCG